MSISRVARQLPPALRGPVRRVYRAASPIRDAINRARDVRAMHAGDADVPGALGWLIKLERTYGGRVTDVRRSEVSPYDGRTQVEVRHGGMTGGDRMSFVHNAYGARYSRLIPELIGREVDVVVEVGILRGTGLAIWCDAFPDARVVGLDIDPSHFEENMPTLVHRGAFSRNQPEVYKYDQLGPCDGLLADVFDRDRIDFLVDDGLHTTPAIVSSLRKLVPFMSTGGIYVIEDNPHCLGAVRGATPNHWKWRRMGDLVVGVAGTSTHSTRDPLGSR